MSRQQDNVSSSGALRPRLRLLSFNMQVGLQTGHYGHYLTRAWRHAWPGHGHHDELDRIAELARQYDFVALQEADAGSLRTRFLNQLEYIARRAGFAYWGHAVTRDLRPVARHCLGYLSRWQPLRTEEHVLPSRIPGRRAMLVELGPQAHGLRVMMTHLSLSRAARQRQLEYLGGVLRSADPLVLMGDFNCGPEFLRHHGELRASGLWLPDSTPHTFPSWRPSRSIDHVLASPRVKIHRLEALPEMGSDHLPLAAEISVEEGA